MTLYNWANFAFCTVVVALYFGLPPTLGRAMAALAWLVMFLVLIFGSRL